MSKRRPDATLIIPAGSTITQLYTLQEASGDAVETVGMTHAITTRTPRAAAEVKIKLNALAELGRFDEVKPCVEDAMSKQWTEPEKADICRRAALLFQKKKDNASAMEMITQAIQRNPENADNYFTQGVLYINVGQYEDAFNVLGECIKRDSKHMDALHNMGITLMRLGRHAESLEYLDRAITIKPTALEYFNKAWALHILQSFDDAVDPITKAIDAISDLPAQQRAQAYYIRATSRSHQKKVEQALEDLTQCQRICSKNKVDVPEASFLLGNIKMDAKQYDEAIKHLQTYQSTVPDATDVLLPLADAYRHLAKWSDAKKYYALYIQKHQDVDSKVHYHYSRTLAALKDYDCALQILESGMKLCTESIVYYDFYLAKTSILIELERYDAAFATANLAIKCNARDAHAYHNRGVVFAHMHKTTPNTKCAQDAINDFKKAIEFDSTLGESYISLVTVLLTEELWDEAMQYINLGCKQRITLEPSLYKELGQELCNHQKYTDGIGFLKKGNAPNRELAKAYQELGDHTHGEEAIVAYKASIKLFKSVHCYCKLALLEPEHASEHISSALKLKCDDYIKALADAIGNDDMHQCYYHLGMHMLQAKQYDNALTALKKAPPTFKALKAIGDAHTHLKNTDSAIDAYVSALQCKDGSESDNQQLSKILAQQYVQRGKDTGDLKYYLAALKHAPNDHAILSKAGDMYVEMSKAINIDKEQFFYHKISDLLEIALKYYTQALQQRAHEPDKVGYLHAKLSHVYESLGDFSVSLEMHEYYTKALKFNTDKKHTDVLQKKISGAIQLVKSHSPELLQQIDAMETSLSTIAPEKQSTLHRKIANIYKVLADTGQHVHDNYKNALEHFQQCGDTVGCNEVNALLGMCHENGA